jgi:hypothetical protein
MDRIIESSIGDKMDEGGTLRLNASFFTADRLKTNKHKLSQGGRISYPTTLRYLSGEIVEQFNGRVLYSLLVQGFGYTPEAAADLRLGDVFEIVPNGET